MITADNILQHEFIGLQTEIIHSTNPQLVGLNGTITNETKSMIQLETKKGIKLIPKSINTWKFNLNNQNIDVDGTKIHKRPFDRLGGKA
ncbi:MAG: ribonuclease P protein subunit [Nitrososphaeria archaeon]|nr:ribonuclease P protein subunit [Nitrosopumilaceae archaeon]NIP09228.1 ribonuclease P protein subunit [Nitrosopumilaceae archaeon]NIP91919.1 ribonuclease P protein subunit [Nitrososphaeria archaeon]NIS96012.1 ribonuclease P protein subunit [Nitrosopumilaceae archaeon]